LVAALLTGGWAMGCPSKNKKTTGKKNQPTLKRTRKTSKKSGHLQVVGGIEIKRNITKERRDSPLRPAGRSQGKGCPACAVN